jgi:protein-S-isoprenylcysteine O-methyltransferase Ste14
MLLFGKRYADTVARLRVPTGFLLVVVFAWFSRPTPRWMAFGVPVALAGLGLRAWAAGCLAKNRQLATGGPYAYTRNPLYLGTLMVAAGLAIASRSVGLGVLAAAVFLFIYLPVIQLEEQHLRRLFPEYQAYAHSVPPLWPRLRPIERYGAARFQPALYLKNQEYNAAAGFAAGLAFLIWKMGR